MRLLVVSSWFPAPPDNGSRLRAFHLLRHLSQRHTITLLSFGRDDAAEDTETVGAWCESLQVVRPSGAGRGATGWRGLLSTVPRSHAQTLSPDLRARIGALRPRHDALLALQVHAAFHAMDEAPRMPSVFDELEIGSVRDQHVVRPRGVAVQARRRLTWWKFLRFHRRLVAAFDRTTVVSGVERDLAAACGLDAARIDVVPNGVEPRGLPLPARRERRLIYPGPITYEANFDAVRWFVTEVLPAVRARHPDLTFVVTGSTGGRDVSDLARVPGVTFTARLPDVGPILAGSLACVVPLRFGGGTRLKVLEAMAAGVPVVSTSKGIEGLEGLQPGRHLLLGDSADALADAITRVADDPDQGDRLAAAARPFVLDRYGWGALAAGLDDVLAAAVEAHARHHR